MGDMQQTMHVYFLICLIRFYASNKHVANFNVFHLHGILGNLVYVSLAKVHVVKLVDKVTSGNKASWELTLKKTIDK